MKLYARFEVEDAFGNVRLLKALDDHGAIVLRLTGIGESPQSLENLAPKIAPPAFWKKDPRDTVGLLRIWLTDSTAYRVLTVLSHPVVEKGRKP